MPHTATPTNFENLAQLLEKNAEYQVVRRFDTKAAGLLRLSSVPAGARLGLVLDTETTGKKPTDKIVELGLVKFAYNALTGAIYGVVDTFNQLEDPGMPLDPAASAVNGITDEMVAGQRIDDAQVNAMAADVDFVVAHNSDFDRPKTEARFPVFKDKAWACSMRQVDWASEGISSAKLEYIAYRQGFFFEAHRADADCMALLNVLSQPMASLDGQPALKGLLTNYTLPSSRIYAVNSPFETKDMLKDRGYRWNDGTAPGSLKAWAVDVEGDALQDELAWLKSRVYGNRAFALPVDQVDAYTRFSTRNGQRQTCYL